MTKFLTQTLGCCAALLMVLTGCQKDGELVTIQPSNLPTLATSAPAVVLTQANANNTAMVFTWTKVASTTVSGTTENVAPGMAYQLQFAKAGTNFASAVAIDAGNGPTTAVKVSDLNAALQSLGLTTGVPTALEVRLNANYAANFVHASPAVALTATTYCAQPEITKAWSIIGTVGPGADWSDDYLLTYDCAANVYTYTGTLKVGEYKFRYGKDWTANLGGSSSTGGALEQDGGNLKITAAKTYTIKLMPAGVDGTTKKALTGSTFTIQ